jgi:hypothetical protein
MSYINNKQPITNGKFKQKDIDNWRKWNPCPIQPEHWHDDMLNYISFDVTFTDYKPIISMHFTIDDLVVTCCGSIPIMVKTTKTETISNTIVNTEKLIPYLRVYIKIINNLFMELTPVTNCKTLYNVLKCDLNMV